MLDGFLVVDKPAGMSSHQVVAMLRRTLGEKKIGHTGTLDPFATGVLPIALGEGTKAITFLDESVKEYRATMRLGISTDTQDLEGEILEQRGWSHVTREAVESLVQAFSGNLLQVPPMFSALKRDGVPLYKLARKGETVEREPRAITVHSLEMERIELPEVSFTVRCSRGTYVRTLAHDMGESLGCGAHLLALRRTKSGPFSLENSFTLDEIAVGPPREVAVRHFVPVRTALAHLPELELTPAGSARVRNGIPPLEGDLASGSAIPSSGRVILTSDGTIAAVAEVILPGERRGGSLLRICRGFNQVSALQ